LPAILFIFPPVSSVILHKAKKSTADERRSTPIDPETAVPVASVAEMRGHLSSDGAKSRRVRFQNLIGVDRRSSAVSERIWGISRFTGLLFCLHPVHLAILSKKGTHIPKTIKRLWLRERDAVLPARPFRRVG
jgi:hypothetical protein